jgi:DEAD/DEAH box helicase domain-containing protein
VFSAIRGQAMSKFPYPWLNYVEQHRGELLDRFVRLFNQADRNPLTEATQAWLSKFINGSKDEPGSLGWKIIDKLNGIAKDVDELKRQRERTAKEVEKLQAVAVRGEEDEAELVRLMQERTALSRLIGSIEGKATLNVLTDEGLLPNYAFPEQGVLLRSIIVREAKPGGGAPDPLTFEYERPSASAITELAPNNTFYAEGRRVVVNQVDVSKIKPEAWRFCRQCSYAEPLSSGDHHANCPRCGDTMWRDSGRVREMLKLTTVFARTLDRDSRIADDSDERQRGFYVRQALVDSPPDAVRNAYVIDKPEFPFGFEFLDRVTFREVNFGEQAPDASPMTIAGAEMNRPGFSICPECGTLQRRRKAEEMYRNHAPYCSKRKDPEASTQQCVFLYREFASEGIRLFLPEVGFRRHRGAAAQLRFGAGTGADAPLPRRGRPPAHRAGHPHGGGPGDPAVLSGDLRQRAWRHGLPEGTDACPRAAAGGAGAGAAGAERVRLQSGRRCRWLLPLRVRVPQQLRPRVDLAPHRAEAAERGGAAQGSAEAGGQPLGRADRESAVRQHAGEAFCRGTATRAWWQALQPDRGAVQGQAGLPAAGRQPALAAGAAGQLVRQRWRRRACKPDFVFWPDDGADDLPIAVFLDGWQFHKGLIPVDLAKRMAVAKSGKFSVWTLTWDDIDSVLQGKDSATASPWPTLLVEGGANVVPKMCEAQGLGNINGFKSLSPFMQLHQRLSDWRHEDMRKLAVGPGDRPW